jgi:hypothetical protein
VGRMKVISESKNKKKKEVIIDGKTRHIHLIGDVWHYCKNYQIKDGQIIGREFAKINELKDEK